MITLKCMNHFIQKIKKNIKDFDSIIYSEQRKESKEKLISIMKKIFIFIIQFNITDIFIEFVHLSQSKIQCIYR